MAVGSYGRAGWLIRFEMGSVMVGNTISSMREMANRDIIIGVSLFEFMVITPDGGLFNGRLAGDFINIV